MACCAIVIFTFLPLYICFYLFILECLQLKILTLWLTNSDEIKGITFVLNDNCSLKHVRSILETRTTTVHYSFYFKNLLYKCLIKSNSDISFYVDSNQP